MSSISSPASKRVKESIRAGCRALCRPIVPMLPHAVTNRLPFLGRVCIKGPANVRGGRSGVKGPSARTVERKQRRCARCEPTHEDRVDAALAMEAKHEHAMAIEDVHERGAASEVSARGCSAKRGANALSAFARRAGRSASRTP